MRTSLFKPTHETDAEIIARADAEARRMLTQRYEPGYDPYNSANRYDMPLFDPWAATVEYFKTEETP